MEKYGFVYIWYDRKYKRYYIGCHWGREDDGYICSSTWMRNSFNRRKEDFKRRIITKTSIREELFELEDSYLNLIKNEEFGTKYYNLQKHWKHWSKKEYTRLSTKERISQKTKEAMARPEVKQKYKESLKTRNTRSSDPEVRVKRAKSMLGKNVGKIHTAETREKNRLGHLGKVHSDETKSKIAAAGVFKSLNTKVVSCVHCGTKGNPGNIGRYHNDKCKSKLINSLSITG